MHRVQARDTFQVNWIVRFEIGMAFAFCLLCQVPYFFQYEITPCPNPEGNFT